MKKSWMIIVSFLACAFLVAACGYGGQGQDGGTDGQDGNGGGDQQGNECAQAAEVQMQGFDEACAPRGAICCFCMCWNQGRRFYDTELYINNETCVCIDTQPNPQPCEGSVLTDAQACLADQTTCRADAMDAVTNVENGICTHTPL